MNAVIKKAMTEVVAPIWRRPKRHQVAALCLRQDDEGQKILLITSRETKRWVLPKGWPMPNIEDPQAALQEAWEEAGISEGNLTEDQVGTYEYTKVLGSGLPLPVIVHIYRVDVTDIVDKFPESHERKRKWVTPEQAADMVNETSLRQFFCSL